MPGVRGEGVLMWEWRGWCPDQPGPRRFGMPFLASRNFLGNVAAQDDLTVVVAKFVV
ncbi:MAG TPA: hypothetical protein VMG82_32875 [Candidatus Sulfotelmatobacter sp.]|nr:hypothetical protein [Candidatus Sulfotelmatobacter sp.]